MDRGSSLRAKMGWKKKVRREPTLRADRAPGQLSMKQAEVLAWNEKVAWKGGLVAVKNTKEVFDDGDG